MFFSPTYGTAKDEQGNAIENALIGGALTNRPFLNMPAVTLASEERVSEALDADPAARFHVHALDGQFGDLTRALVMLDVSAGERKLAVKEGNSLPDGSYPIRNTAQLHSAAILAASGHGDAAGAKKLIRRRAKELGVTLTDLPGFSSDSRALSMNPELLTLLGLDETADDTKILEAVTELKTNAEKPAEKPVVPEVKTLEEQAREQGMMILDAERVTKLVADATAGRKAATELHEERRDRVWTRALEQMVRVPDQKDAFEKQYALDAETTVASIEDDVKAGRKLLNAKPIGETVDDSNLSPGDRIVKRTEEIQKELSCDYNEAYLKVLDEIEEGKF